MIAYGLLVIAALYLIVKWSSYLSYKKRAMSREQMDAALIERLNQAEDAHVQ
ncbi:MAG: hypothetical protein K0Q59_4836 [Paenibacillus sp.]|jgi:hypothetical protein|nr:hypothetical protein [Paenibacillus sp.]